MCALHGTTTSEKTAGTRIVPKLGDYYSVFFISHFGLRNTYKLRTVSDAELFMGRT